MLTASFRIATGERIPMPNYNDDFRPSRGDVTYGISPACSAYLSSWEQALQPKLKSTDQGVKDPAALDYAAAFGMAKTNRMDCYNNYYGVPSIAQGASEKKGMKALDDKIATAPNERMKAYARGIQQSRFSPATVFHESKDKLQSEGYQKSNFDSTKFFADSHKKEQALAQNRNYLAIRRACKFGIGLVATDPQFAGAKVHFILDGLDMTEVATKGTRSSAQTKGPAKVAVSITVSELRYVYRNWGQLSNKVILYVNLIPVAAPWLQNWGPLQCIGSFPATNAQKNLWDAYEADRKNKYGVTDVADIMKALL
jgi:hypothetical protein